MTPPPRGFYRRAKHGLHGMLRSHVDLPEAEALAVVALADREQAETGEAVSPQKVIRLFVRAGLAAVKPGKDGGAR